MALTTYTAGEVLTAASLNDNLAYAVTVPVSTPSGLVYITGAGFTSSTTISMAAGVFTSTYKSYQVVFKITSGSDCQISVRVNNAGTPRTSGSYYGGSNRIGSNNTNIMTASSAATSLNLCARVNGEGFGLTMTVFDPTDATTKTPINAVGVAGNDSNYPAAINAGGIYYTAEANDGLTWIAGAAVTGFYRVYGLSES